MPAILFVLGLMGAVGLEPARAAAQPQVFAHLFVLPGDDRVLGERGRLQVPETAKPGARRIEIAFARVRSTSRNPGPPIFWIEGGPGASSIGAFTEKPAMIAMLREYGDVIAVDQRGAGESAEVLDCAQRWALPVDRPIGHSEMAADTRRIFGECRAQWVARGVDLDGYNSAAYADDLLRVADALGYGKVRLHAFSYGTQIALAAIARHPARIERATLFGVMGLESLRDPAALDAVLGRVSGMLAASPAGKAYPSLEQLAQQAIKAVTDQPITLSGTRDELSNAAATIVIDATALKSFIVGAIGSRRELPGLPRFLSAVAGGTEGRVALSTSDETVKSVIEDVSWTRRGPAHRRAALQHYATVCATGVSAETHKALLQKRASSILGQTQHGGLPEACDALKVADVGAALRAIEPARLPLLLVGGSIDTKTPLAQAQAVAATHPGAALITVEGAGHGDLVGNRDVEPLVRAFLGGQPPTARVISLPPIEFMPPS